MAGEIDALDRGEIARGVSPNWRLNAATKVHAIGDGATLSRYRLAAWRDCGARARG